MESGQPISVLSVEDDFDSQKSLVELLEMYDLEVSSCSSYEQALSLAKSKPYQMIILDINLEGSSGYYLSNQIRKIQKENKHLLCPILANSGRTNTKQQTYKLYGITEYYEKPLLVKNILEVLNKYLISEETI